MDTELLKAFELVAEYDRTRTSTVKEPRLYYREDGSIIGLWETDHPEGTYIVLDDLTIFTNTSTLLLQVVDGKLKKISTSQPVQTQLIKSAQGQRVVAGHAAIAVTQDEEYQDIEYYDRKTNN